MTLQVMLCQQWLSMVMQSSSAQYRLDMHSFQTANSCSPDLQSLPSAALRYACLGAVPHLHEDSEDGTHDLICGATTHPALPAGLNKPINRTCATTGLQTSASVRGPLLTN